MKFQALILKVVLVLSFISVLMACNPRPTIELAKITKPGDLKGNEIDSYYLRKSTIKIEKTGTKKNADGKEVDDLSITSNPEEYNKFKIVIRPHDSLGVHTNLQITKSSNTDLIQEAGVEVIDKRVDYITKIGTLVTTVVGALKVPPPPTVTPTPELQPQNLPKTIDVNDLLETNNVYRDPKADVDAKEWVTINFGPIPPDARPISDFLSPTVMHGLIYSACRDATVKFKYKDDNYQKKVKINDPRFFQTISFPVKGKVSFHSECGVSVSSEKETGVSTTVDIINALATQGKAIKDAIEATKPKETPKPSKPK